MPTIALVTILGILLAVGGLGYGASSGKFDLSGGDAHDGKIALLWTTPEHVSGSAAYVGCASSFTTTFLSLHATNLAPQTNCSLSATIKNSGSLPAALDSVFLVISSRGCSFYAYSDNVYADLTDPIIAAGGTFTYHATLSLLSGAGNSCERTSALVLVLITGDGQCPDTHGEWTCD
jgi:hypothetical protein